MNHEVAFETVDSAYESTNFKRGDVVKLYKEGTKLSFPCIVLTCKSDLEMFRVEALKGVLGHRSLLSDDSLYTVYINMGGQLIQIGVLPNTRLKFLLGSKVFAVFDKKVHLSETETIEGDLLYALCTASV